jgi:hypothetical protein
MAQIVTHKQSSLDYESYLYELWKKRIAFNPELFDDRISHTSGRCKCRCTRNASWMEQVRNKKK